MKHRMKRTRWWLLLICLPLIVCGRICVNWEVVNLEALAVARNGRIVGVVSYSPHSRYEIREWSSDLSHWQTILEWPPPIDVAEFLGRSDDPLGMSLCANSDGSVVVLADGHSDFFAADTLAGRKLWQAASDHNLPQRGELFFTDADRYIVAHGYRRFGGIHRHLGVIRANDGADIGNVVGRNVRAFYSRGDEVGYVGADGRAARLQLDGQRYRSTQDRLAEEFARDFQEQVLYGVPPNDQRWPISASTEPERFLQTRIARGSERIPASIQIIGARTYRAILSASPLMVGIAVLLLATVAAAALALLMRNAMLCADGRRTALDLCFVVSTLLLMYTSFDPKQWMPAMGSQWDGEAIALPFAAALSGLLLVFLFVNRPLYNWVAVFVACLLPFLAPLIVTAAVFRFGKATVDRRRSLASNPTNPNSAPANARGKLRFGILEMLLVTAASASMIGFGSHNLLMIPFGFMLVLLFALAILLSWVPQLAFFCATACLFGIVCVECGEPLLWTVDPVITFVLTVSLVFSFCSVYGFSLRPSKYIQAAL